MPNERTGSSGRIVDQYQGPVTVKAGVDNGYRWVWVSNGTLPAAEVFAEPGTLSIGAPLVWASVPRDEVAADQIIESSWSEGLRLEEPDVGAADPDESTIEEASSAVLEEVLAKSFGGREHLGLASIRVLGSIEIKGWIHEPDRAILTELACYLGVHGAEPANPG